MTVPFKNYPQVPVEPLAGKVVIDTNNYYFERDGHFADIDSGQATASGKLAEHLRGAQVVKAFNSIRSAEIGDDATPAGTPNRRALPIAGDDDGAKQVVRDLIEDFGFDVVDAGPLAEGRRFDRDQPAYGAPLALTTARGARRRGLSPHTRGSSWGGLPRQRRRKISGFAAVRLRHRAALRRRDALRHAAARGRLAARADGGRRPGHLRRQVHRRRAGRKALIADVIVGSLASALGLPVPALVTVEVDPVLAANEPDEEVQDLLRASAGRNLGVDFLPGALDLDPNAFDIDPGFAGQVLWFDAFVANVDRSWRNPNMLFWHGRPYLIDHGAALTFHHNWPTADQAATRPYDASEHVLIGSHPDLDAADQLPITRHRPHRRRRRGTRRVAGRRAGLRGTGRGAGGLRRLLPLAGWRRRTAGCPLFGEAVAPGRNAGSAGLSTMAVAMTTAATLRVRDAAGRPAGGTRRVDQRRCAASTAATWTTWVRRCTWTSTGCEPAARTPTSRQIDAVLNSLADTCTEDGAGPAAAEDIGRRFRWLTAPRSTVVQPGPVHTGLTTDPAAELLHLLEVLVLPVPG